MQYCDSILETIGNTPLIRLNKVNKDLKGTILVKVEYFNPGHSMKDRMALKMLEVAEQKGYLKPGGTIVENTSGNTGLGLALAAAVKGYRCIFTVPDKQSKAKIDILKALGAEVVVCPTNVSADDPRSYYSKARSLAETTPNAFFFNQYDNPANALAHYETTGPEIWQQTGGKITHFVAGVGTGGSISGISKYLKAQNPAITTVGVDSYGSVLKKYKETGEFDKNEIYPYLLEGIGEDILPKNVNFDLIDSFVKVTDKDSALMARALAKEEGLLIGWSCGAAVRGALDYAQKHLKEDDIMVVILPDHGTRYLGKIYNDDWMVNYGFLEDENTLTAQDIIHNNKRPLITVTAESTVEEAVILMTRADISQLPIFNTPKTDVIGSITDNKLLEQIMLDPTLKQQSIAEVMQAPFQFVGLSTTLKELFSHIKKGNRALMVRDQNNDIQIITRQDIMKTII